MDRIDAFNGTPTAIGSRRLDTATAPYARLATRYDRLIGRPFFDGLRVAFEQLVRRHGIRFRAAADLGCGTGLFACYLARRYGIPVYALDRSQAMLAVARRKCRQPGVHFVKQDMRELQLPRRVDLVTANFDAVNHLLSQKDLMLAFDRVAKALRPGGHFIFDVFTPRICSVAGLTLRRPVGGDDGFVVQRITACARDGRFQTTLWHRRPNGSRDFEVRNTERAYSLSTITRILRQAGLSLRAAYDARTLQPNRGKAIRLIIVAAKSA